MKLTPQRNGEADLWLFCLFGWLVGFLTSSSTTMLYRGRAPRQSVWQFYVLPHMRQSWETMNSVSAGDLWLARVQIWSKRSTRTNYWSACLDLDYFCWANNLLDYLRLFLRQRTSGKWTLEIRPLCFSAWLCLTTGSSWFLFKNLTNPVSAYRPVKGCKFIKNQMKTKRSQENGWLHMD